MLRPDPVKELGPELTVQLAPGSGSSAGRRRAYQLLPVIRQRDHPEQWGGIGSADPDHFQLDAEEVGVLVGVLVEPRQRLAVLVAEARGDPHDRRRGGPRRIGEQLAEVAVVGVAELVLHDQDYAVGLVLADDVERIPANGMFGALELHLDAECLSQAISALRQPGREIQGLVGPDGPRVYGFKPTQMLLARRGQRLRHAGNSARTRPSLARLT